MSKSACAMAMLAAGVLLAAPVAAQEKKKPVRATKVMLENDKARATESVFKPGEQNPMEARGYRITRVLKGSTTVERRHKDGKVEKIEWREGGVYQAGPDNASTRNIGKGEVTIYTVTLKQAK